MTQEERQRIRDLKDKVRAYPSDAREQAINDLTTHIHPDHQPSDYFDGKPLCSF